MLESREQKIDEFYRKNPEGKFCCDYCLRELTEEEYKHSIKVVGLRLCPACLDDELHKQESCAQCGKANVELNYYSNFGRICCNCFQNIPKGVSKMSELQDYVKRNSKTLTLKDGESAEVVYKGYKIGANKYDPEKESVYYSFETSFGIKTFQSGALGLANLFDSIEKDTAIRLTRHGEGNKTKYFIEKKVGSAYVPVGREAEEEE